MNARKLALFGGSAVIIAGGLLYVLGVYPPASGRAGQGAIGQRNVYRAEQPKDASVNPDDAPVATEAIAEQMKLAPELKNGQIFQLNTGQLYQMTNNKLLAVRDGMTFQLATGQMLQMQNGRLLALQNGKLLALQDGMMYHLANGQVFRMAHGGMMQMMTGNMMHMTGNMQSQLRQ